MPTLKRKPKRKPAPHSLTKEQIANVKRWVKALRSGKYEQGQGSMFSSGKYCCLGVECSVNRRRNWKGKETHPHYFAVGLKDSTGDFKGKCLVSLNDGYRWSFRRIARFIEQQLKTNSKGLFVR